MDIRSPMMPDFKGSPLVFVKEVRSELSKVIWPTRNEVIKLTLIVVGVSIALGIYIGGLDFVFVQITSLFINR